MKKKVLNIYRVDTSSKIVLPYADAGIKAGFPSPAQDYIELSIDLNKELIKNAASTFLGRVVGDSMLDADLYDGDILIIDKEIDKYVRKRKKSKDERLMAVCFIDGEFTVKYLNLDEQKDGIIWLIPANENYKPIKVTPENQFEIWGIVTYSIRKRA